MTAAIDSSDTDPVRIPGATGSIAANEKLAQCWYRAFDEGDAALLEAILASGWVDIPAPPGTPPGAAGAVRTMKALREAFPDFRITVKDILHDGNRVVVRSAMSGTQCGTFLGMQASGKTLEIQAIDIHDIRAGRIFRTWHSEDWMNGLRQLGFFTAEHAATRNPEKSSSRPG
ncbi:ester cyclase [Pseudoduganella plicata]|nr:ester cyclase [Pseudoduganella plicata]GGY96444.1 hypothetical protein GCM10007388_32410 [Pseudoduganella plicata]